MNFRDASEVRRRDPSGMLDLIRRLPDMCAEAWRLSPEPAFSSTRPTAIVALGMGGSGIGGDLLRAVAHAEAPVPVVAVKDYRAPGFLSSTSLVFVCSYSGNTEETLTAYDQAAAKGAPCVVVTSGGDLLRAARDRGHPAVVVPKGLPPRAALAYLFLPMLAILSAARITRAFDDEMREAVEILKAIADRLGPDRPSNQAQRLAERLAGRIPVVYSASPFLEPAAQRWKDQFNENAKTFAAWNTFPELNHNETVGWGMDEALARSIHVIILRDRAEPPRLAQRVAITKDLAFRRAAGVDEIQSEGEGKLARLLSSIMTGDMTSWYLAVLRGVDPTPVPVIDELKKRLAETGAV